MGLFTSFATGFIEGSVQKMKDEADAQAKERELVAAEQERYGGYLLDYLKTDDPQAGIAQMFAKRAGINTDFSYLANTMNDVENTTAFGRGKNAVLFNWNYSDKKLGESAGMNLRDYQSVLSNPELRNDYLSKFQANPSAAKQFLGTVDSHLIQYEQDFHFKNSGKDQTGTIKSPVYTDFSNFKNVISFADELRTSMGIDGVAAEYRVIQGAINTQTKGAGLEANQIFVKTDSGSDGRFTGAVMDIGEDEKLFLDTLAADKGFIDGNHMLYNMDDFMYEEGGGTANVNLLLAQTKRLSDAGALKMLNAVGADDDTENNVAQILFGKNGVSPKGDLPKMMAAVLPLIPEPREFRVSGTVVPDVNGTKFMEARGIDVADLKNKYTFGKKATQLQELIINNIQDGKVKLGFAGMMQRIGIGITGPGGQLNQLFGDVPVDELEEGTSYKTLQETTAAVLGKYNIDIEGALGETQTAAIQLAYAQARAVDSNGRLSDNDFKIQLDQILGSGLFQNTNVQVSSLKTLNKQFKQVVEDSEFYVNMANRSITSKEAKMFEANVVIQRARERDRAMKAGRFDSTSVVTATTFKQMQEQGMEFTNAPYAQEGFEYFRNNNGQLVERNVRDDSARVVTDVSSVSQFYTMGQGVNKPTQQEQTPPQNKPEEAPAEPAENTTTGAGLIPAKNFAGNPPPFQDGFYIIDGKKHRRIESTGPSGNLEPFYKEVK